MATKAVSRIKVDWSKLASQISKDEMSQLNKLKSKVDGTVARLSVLPDKLPTIDWAHYKAHAADPKVVEEIEKRYTSMKIEAPKAPASRLESLEKAKQQDLARYTKFVDVAESYIKSAEVLKEKFEKMIPMKDMTIEDYFLTFPEWSYSIQNPSFAPHLGRSPGLTREEAAAFDQPDPRPFATPTAWKDWEKRKKLYE